MKKILFIFYIFLFQQYSFSNEGLANTQRFDQNAGDVREDPKIIKNFPALKKFLFKAPESNFHLGFGISPIGLAGEKFLPSISLFQFHYISKSWDFEVFSASLGRYFSSNEFATGAYTFLARSSPKFKVMRKMFGVMDLSIGPMVGLELIRFNNIDVALREVSSGQQTDIKTPFKLSEYSFIFGVNLSQTFDLASGKKFKITESFYKQGYDVKNTGDGFEYVAIDPETLTATQTLSDPAVLQEIEKATVMMIEFSYLY